MQEMRDNGHGNVATLGQSLYLEATWLRWTDPTRRRMHCQPDAGRAVGREGDLLRVKAVEECAPIVLATQCVAHRDATLAPQSHSVLSLCSARPLTRHNGDDRFLGRVRCRSNSNSLEVLIAGLVIYGYATRTQCRLDLLDMLARFTDVVDRLRGSEAFSTVLRGLAEQVS